MPDITISANPVTAGGTAAALAGAAQSPTDGSAASPFAALLQQLTDPALAGLPPGQLLAAATDPVTAAADLETLLPLLLGAKGLNTAGTAPAADADASGAETTEATINVDPSAQLLLGLPGLPPAALPQAPAGPPPATDRVFTAATSAPAVAANLAAAPESAMPTAAAADDGSEAFAALLGREQAQTHPTAMAAAAPTAVAAPAAAAQPGSPVQAATIPVPVGTRDWGDQVGDRLVWMAGRQESRAELVLTPPQLGRIEVSLTVSGDQTNALFVSSNPAVREALESALPRLREILADAGITLGQAQVNSEAPGQSAQQRENGDNPRQMQAGSASGAAAPLAARTAGAWVSGGRGLVDVFA
jgi:flagellar hook-length control protein FliK